MRLLTKGIEAALVKASGNDSGGDHQPVVVKFFTPDAQCTWFILDGSREPNGDWRLFGLCDLGMGCPELGYVMLSELQAIRGQFRLPVERDISWTGDLAKAKREVGA